MFNLLIAIILTLEIFIETYIKANKIFEIDLKIYSSIQCGGETPKSQQAVVRSLYSKIEKL